MSIAQAEPTKEPFRSIHRAVESAIFSLAKKGMPVDIDDARQEAWASCLAALDRYKPEKGRLYSYAHTIAKRAAYNHATWSSSPLTLSRVLIESGGRVVQDRYSRALSLETRSGPVDDGQPQNLLDMALTMGLPTSDRDPEREAHQARVDRARAVLRRVGVRLALKRCTQGMGRKIRLGLGLMLAGSTLHEAAQDVRVEPTRLRSSLGEFVRQARGDLALASIAAKLEKLEQ